ncbi:MAG: hypothetical protein DHS80DRAFT_30995 [Piptocephalis tieghemiana]|nr:MAG: hypothetical protein DHS80DRAFT_30995 [Piptocephalis tieghemiana]
MRLVALPILLTLLTLTTVPNAPRVQAAPIPAWSVGKLAKVSALVGIGVAGSGLLYSHVKGTKENEKERQKIEALKKEKQALAEANALASSSPKAPEVPSPQPLSPKKDISSDQGPTLPREPLPSDQHADKKDSDSQPSQLESDQAPPQKDGPEPKLNQQEYPSNTNEDTSMKQGKKLVPSTAN